MINTNTAPRHSKYPSIVLLNQHGLIGYKNERIDSIDVPKFFKTIENSNILEITASTDAPLQIIFPNGLDQNNAHDNFIKLLYNVHDFEITRGGYLYGSVDKNNLNGDIRFDILPKHVAPIYDILPPSKPVFEQLWFDLENNIYKIYNAQSNEFEATSRWDEINEQYIETRIVIFGLVNVFPLKYELEYWVPNKSISSQTTNIQRTFKLEQNYDFETAFGINYNTSYVENTNKRTFYYHSDNIKNIQIVNDQLTLFDSSVPGWRITPNIYLDPLDKLHKTKVSWDGSPDVIVESSVSFNSGNTFTDYQECENNGIVPQITEDQPLDNIVLKFRQILYNNDSYLNEFKFRIFADETAETSAIIETPQNIYPTANSVIDKFPIHVQGSEFNIDNVTDYISAVQLRIRDINTSDVIVVSDEISSPTPIVDIYYLIGSLESYNLNQTFEYQIRYKTLIYELWSEWSNPTPIFLKFEPPVIIKPQNNGQFQEFYLYIQTDETISHHVQTQYQILKDDLVIYDNVIDDNRYLLKLPLYNPWETNIELNKQYKCRVRFYSSAYERYTQWQTHVFTPVISKPQNLNYKNQENVQESPISLDSSFVPILGEAEYIVTDESDNTVYNNTNNLLPTSVINQDFENGMPDNLEIYSPLFKIKNNYVYKGSNSIGAQGSWLGENIALLAKWEMPHLIYSPYLYRISFYMRLLWSGEHRSPDRGGGIQLYDINGNEILGFGICLGYSSTTARTIYLTDNNDLTVACNGYYAHYANWYFVDITFDYLNGTYQYNTLDLYYDVKRSGQLSVGSILPPNNIIFRSMRDGSWLDNTDSNNKNNIPIMFFDNFEFEYLDFDKTHYTHNIASTLSIPETDSIYKWNTRYFSYYFNSWSEWSNLTQFIIPSIKKPVNLSPANNLNYFPRNLQTNNFALTGISGSLNELHGKTQWQAKRISDGLVVYDYISEVDLREHNLHPWDDILFDETYEWYVRYKLKNYDIWSEWSEPFRFITTEDIIFVSGAKSEVIQENNINYCVHSIQIAEQWNDDFSENTSQYYIQNAFNDSYDNRWNWDTNNNVLEADNSNKHLGVYVDPTYLNISEKLNYFSVKTDYIATGDDDVSGIMIYDELNNNIIAATITNTAITNTTWSNGLHQITSFDDATNTRLVSGNDYNVKENHTFELIYENNQLKFYVDNDLSCTYNIDFHITTFGLLSIAQDPGAKYDNLFFSYSYYLTTKNTRNNEFSVYFYNEKQSVSQPVNQIEEFNNVDFYAKYPINNIDISPITVYKPINKSPINTTNNIAYPIELKSFDFSINEFNGEDIHGYSQYRIINKETQEIVYDTDQITDLTRHIVTELWDNIQFDVIYEWQTRHKSAYYGIWSEWSDVSEFIPPKIKKPIGISPKNAEIYEFPITLESSNYRFTNTTETFIPSSHFESEWRIRKISDNIVVYESGWITDLITHIIPQWSGMQLFEDFEWEVRYKSAYYNIISEWSEPAKITPTVGKPQNLSPENGFIFVYFPHILQFNDYLTHHSQTQINIIKKETQIVVFDNTFTENLCEYDITDLLLNQLQYNIQYEWQVRYYSSFYNVWTEWSDKTEFNIMPNGVYDYSGAVLVDKNGDLIKLGRNTTDELL